MLVEGQNLRNVEIARKGWTRLKKILNVIFFDNIFMFNIPKMHELEYMNLNELLNWWLFYGLKRWRKIRLRKLIGVKEI